MTAERVKRKLSAILSADVKGYSSLMGEDEIATIETLKKYREVMATLIQDYSGHVVDSPGDNLLAEFGSVVDAVQCAVDIQRVLKAKNDELPKNRKMETRLPPLSSPTDATTSEPPLSTRQRYVEAAKYRYSPSPPGHSKNPRTLPSSASKDRCRYSTRTASKGQLQ